MSELKSLIDEYVDRHGSSYRSICERLGWSHGTVSSWFKRGRTNPPEAADLRALAIQIQQPYKKLLQATLLDYGYLPEEGQAHGTTPAEKSPDDGEGGSVTELKPRETETPTAPTPAKKAARKGKSQGRALRKTQDDAETGSQEYPNADPGGA